MNIVVRNVTMNDLDQVAPLWGQAWRSAGRRRTDMPLALSMDRLRRRVEVAEGGGYRFLAAWVDDEPVGMATVSLTDGGPMMDAPGVHIHVLYVSKEQRNTGVGTALLSEVTDWAAELGSEQVVVDVPPASQDVQRWYARWGFGPYLQRRVASTATIRRSMGLGPSLHVVRGGNGRLPIPSAVRRAVGK